MFYRKAFITANRRPLQLCQSRASAWTQCIITALIRWKCLLFCEDDMKIEGLTLLLCCCMKQKGAPAELQQATTDQRQLLSQVRSTLLFLLFIFILPVCVSVHRPLWCSTDRRRVLILLLCRPEVLGESGSFSLFTHSIITSLSYIYSVLTAALLSAHFSRNLMS